MSKAIYLTNSDKFAIVDFEDFEKCRQYKWHLNKNGSPYSSVRIGRNCVPMGRFILNIGIDNGLDIDHKNHNRLDNRRLNLRKCSFSENAANKRKRSGTTSKYKGVYYDIKRKRWVAGASFNKKRKFLGRFLTEDEAGIVVNNFYKDHAPLFQVFNIIN